MWLCLAACAFGLVSLPAQAAEEIVDGIAAQVGDQIVTISEVLQMVAPMEAQLRQSGVIHGNHIGKLDIITNVER